MEEETAFDREEEEVKSPRYLMWRKNPQQLYPRRTSCIIRNPAMASGRTASLLLCYIKSCEIIVCDIAAESIYVNFSGPSLLPETFDRLLRSAAFRGSKGRKCGKCPLVRQCFIISDLPHRRRCHLLTMPQQFL
ncbi:hypothetical protein KFK09_008815 [Dendrobium nobile]|uniref:Uncharacterized protein n=1 Tax=Dendrobium nobile TaxID=94219 RepID=A0A8T3BRY3_DENNO|nr:hypothetical protein KFK09_008815 [Dendrobium nobile]